MFSRRIVLALKLCVSLTLLARGWLTWRWDSPIRGLVWKEDWWTGILERQTDLTWSDFAKLSDPWITNGLAGLGIFLMILAVVPWLPMAAGTKFRSIRWLLVPAVLVLILDSVARWVDVEFDFGMAIEHSLQMLAPVTLLIAMGQGKSGTERLLIRLITIGAALTFVGHGFYAIGFHPVPLGYQTMTMKLLGCDQAAALLFLKIVGVLDFVAAVCVFIPVLRKAGLGYMVFWGLATALARVLSHFSVAGIDPWLAETLVRTSHWALPLVALILLLNKRMAAGTRREEAAE